MTKKVSDLNYLLATPDRRKSSQLCHANLPKPYHERPNVPAGGAVSTVALSEGVLAPTSLVNPSVEAQEQDEIRAPDDGVLRARLDNSETLKQLPQLLQHLSGDKRAELICLIQEFLICCCAVDRSFEVLGEVRLDSGMPVCFCDSNGSPNIFSCFGRAAVGQAVQAACGR